ncbi:G8 domain-containing protein, partial [Pirellulales bacterium]|nr:G8 domain-containing protein [Pirellulales bacterium]
SDLLIGGRTAYDADPAALDALLDVWSPVGDYDAKIQAIEDAALVAYLKSGETVFDDLVADALLGNADRDWFFITGTDPIFDPLGNHDHGTGIEPGHDHGEGLTTGHGSHGQIIVVDAPPAVEGFALVDSLDEVPDIDADEAVHTRIPHAGQTLKRAEHLTLFQLVRYADVTHMAVASGDWSNPTTWQGGNIPAAGAKVLIPLGVDVEVDGILGPEIATIRVDGTLTFAETTNAELRVDTMIVSPSGTFEMGTAAAPIAPGVVARLVFTGNGPIDRNWDPFGISRGLITHGLVSMNGAEKTSRVEIVGAPTVGTTSLTLSETPIGWNVGDEVVVAAVRSGVEQNELRTIVAINGNSVTIAPLSYDHTPPRADLGVHLANLTRNVVVESEADQVERRGHVMFMHNRNVDVHYAGFYGLGRTDKFEVVNDSVVDDQWNLTPGTGTNQRARYAVHFHRNGTSASGSPAVVNGSVTVDASGWGFVNHSSFADITNNVAYLSRGAGFVAEAGDEIGRFEGNIAIASLGSGEEESSREPEQDFGHDGNGFWFQGAGVEVVDNVSAGAEGHAFIYYTRGLRQQGIVTEFSAASLADPGLAGGASSISVDDVPVARFADNVGYASAEGLKIRLHLRFAEHGGQSVIEDSLFWNNEVGVNLPYSHNIVLRDLDIYYEIGVYPSNGVRDNIDAGDITYDNLAIAGYDWGLSVAQTGDSVVNGGTFQNRKNIVIKPATDPGRSVTINGAIQFVELPDAGPLFEHENVSMQFRSSSIKGSISHLFYDSVVTLNFNEFSDQRLYFFEQAAAAIAFPVSEPDIPPAYIGLTIQQLFDNFGIAVAGEIAPSDVITTPGIHGIVSVTSASGLGSSAGPSSSRDRLGAM